jgi:hypothetical protein
MWRHTGKLLLATSILCVVLVPSPVRAQNARVDKDWAALDRALGRPGKAQPGDVQKYSFPRGDLRVTVGDVTVKPALALGSWVAFKRTGRSNGAAIAMGDLALTEGELPAVLTKLQEGGVRQTALHNHLQRESPKIMYLHIEGHGDPVRLGETIRAALATTKTPPPSPATLSALELDTVALAKALGRPGTANGGVYQVSVPRAAPIKAGGMEVPPAMGVATAINFQPTGGGKAAITGDFVLTADEVNPVLRTLERQGIAVTALHGHMLTEEPRLLFMHFWANDDALELARGLRAALDKTNSRRAAQ